MKEIKPIFAQTSTADFYPKGKDGLIEITYVAPKDTEVFPGHVVILTVKQYEKLKELEALEYKLRFLKN